MGHSKEGTEPQQLRTKNYNIPGIVSPFLWSVQPSKKASDSSSACAGLLSLAKCRGTLKHHTPRKTLLRFATRPLFKPPKKGGKCGPLVTPRKAVRRTKLGSGSALHGAPQWKLAVGLQTTFFPEGICQVPWTCAGKASALRTARILRACSQRLKLSEDAAALAMDKQELTGTGSAA